MSVFTRLTRCLCDSRSGTAMTEFALAAPLLLSAGLWGVEAANQAVTQMRLSQIAVLIADNASRVGETALLGESKIYESDINDVIYGAHVQGGSAFDLYEHGRVILSSLEVVPESEDDQQYIHWQRCMGKKVHPSSYGIAGDGLDGGLVGMGPSGEEIVAFEGEAVMFVEVVYDYQPLISEMFTHADVLSATAAFNVRDRRDLKQVYQRDPAHPDAVADCNVYNDIEDVTF